MNDINKTLDERKKLYGEFHEHAAIVQGLKACMYTQTGWQRLSDTQKEALEMIQHKIARILNGNPNYLDNWHDIIGYTRLVEKRLEEKQMQTTLFSGQQSV